MVGGSVGRLGKNRKLFLKHILKYMKIRQKLENVNI